jgi:hypothetical protein
MDNNLQKKAIESSVGRHRPSEASSESEDEPAKTFIKKLQHWRLRVGQGRSNGLTPITNGYVFMFN